MADDERFLSMSELMKRYSLTRYAFYCWMRQGKFPVGIRFGRARRWPLSQILEWEAAQLAKMAEEEKGDEHGEAV